MARVRGKAVGGAMRNGSDDSPGQMEDKWGRKAIGSSAIAWVREEMHAAMTAETHHRSSLAPGMRGATIEGAYSCLFRGLLDWDENGVHDPDEIRTKGIIKAAVDRGSRLLWAEYAEFLKGQDEPADEKDDEPYGREAHQARHRAAEPDEDKKTPPAPAGDFASRGGSDSRPGGLFSKDFRVRIGTFLRNGGDDVGRGKHNN